MCYKEAVRAMGIEIDEGLLKQVTALGTRVTLNKGQVIVRFGEGMDKVYVILKGIARSYYLDQQGNDLTKAFMTVGDFCAGEGFFTDQGSVEGVEVLEEIEAIAFGVKELKNFIMENDVLKTIYIKQLENIILYKMNRESSFQIKSATERYIDFSKAYPELLERVNQSYIASYLGISPVSLSRIKRTIREAY